MILVFQSCKSVNTNNRAQYGMTPGGHVIESKEQYSNEKIQ